MVRVRYGTKGYVDLDLSRAEERHGDAFLTGRIERIGGEPEAVVGERPGRVGDVVTVQTVEGIIEASTPTVRHSLQNPAATRRVIAEKFAMPSANPRRSTLYPKMKRLQALRDIALKGYTRSLGKQAGLTSREPALDDSDESSYKRYVDWSQGELLPRYFAEEERYLRAGGRVERFLPDAETYLIGAKEIAQRRRRNPAYAKPKKVVEDEKERFYVNEKKWFTTAERAKAWIAENKDKPEKAPKAPKPEGAKKKPRYEKRDMTWALLPNAPVGAFWKGKSYESVGAALDAALGPKRKKKLVGTTKEAVYMAILMNLVRNIEVREALLATGRKKLHYAEPLYNETLMEIRDSMREQPLRRF